MSCHYCNHFKASKRGLSGRCKLHGTNTMMWENCEDCDTVCHEKGRCPQSKTCICVVLSNNCDGSMDEYNKRGCGKPVLLFSKEGSDAMGNHIDRYIEQNQKKVE